jgi:AcrR family transcriptional regulator
MTSQSPEPAPSHDTKERILATAERLFGAQGYDGTSLRQVTREAEVNLAAVHYHFGGKLELLKAVVARRADEVNRQRLDALAAAEQRAAGRPLEVEEILEAFLGPPLRHSGPTEPDWASFMALVGRINTLGDEAYEALKDVFREVRARFFPAIARALPELSPAELAWRMHFVIGLMSTLIVDRKRLAVLTDGLCASEDPEETLRQVIAFAAAGLRAPPCAVRAVAEPKRSRGSR